MYIIRTKQRGNPELGFYYGNEEDLENGKL